MKFSFATVTVFHVHPINSKKSEKTQAWINAEMEYTRNLRLTGCSYELIGLCVQKVAVWRRSPQV